MHLFLFLAVGSIALFSFLAVATWSGERRREREAYYRSETVKKIAEAQGAGNSGEEEIIAARRRAEAQKLGGLITLAVGIGIAVFLRAMLAADHDPEPAYLAGLIPGLIGLAMLVYAYILGPQGIISRKQ